MKGHKIVFLNGPPRSGKDTLGRVIYLAFNARQYKMAEPLSRAIPAMFDIDPKLWRTMREETKDKPQPALLGLTPRQAMIWLSKEVMKPKFGNDVFGKMALEVLQRPDTSTEITVITDSGFDYEAMPLIEYFGYNNCCLIRLHREGCNFKNDSRNYVTLPIATKDFNNDMDIKDKVERGMSLTELQIIRVVKNLLGVNSRYDE